ncbi:hypothetical protein LX36DRAFT_60995 [Colletotrichum falcatum]|nr:hypothetical protein LX36DRAFT_60995 [Colletotrichum falcatum]
MDKTVRQQDEEESGKGETRGRDEDGERRANGKRQERREGRPSLSSRLKQARSPMHAVVVMRRATDGHVREEGGVWVTAAPAIHPNSRLALGLTVTSSGRGHGSLHLHTDGYREGTIQRSGWGWVRSSHPAWMEVVAYVVGPLDISTAETTRADWTDGRMRQST